MNKIHIEKQNIMYRNYTKQKFAYLLTLLYTNSNEKQTRKENVFFRL